MDSNLTQWMEAGSPQPPISRSWFQGGRPLNAGQTQQGGGPTSGGSGIETSWNPAMRIAGMGGKNG